MCIVCIGGRECIVCIVCIVCILYIVGRECIVCIVYPLYPLYPLYHPISPAIPDEEEAEDLSLEYSVNADEVTMFPIVPITPYGLLDTVGTVVGVIFVGSDFTMVVCEPSEHMSSPMMSYHSVIWYELGLGVVYGIGLGVVYGGVGVYGRGGVWEYSMGVWEIV